MVYAMRIALLSACLLLLMVAFVYAAQPAAAMNWRQGRDFDAQWTQPVSLAWSRTPLRGAIEELAKFHRIAMILDRRVDPDQLVTFEVQQLPLDQAVARLAEQLKLGAARWNDVVYLGPKPTVDNLRTLSALLRESILQQPATARGALTKVKSSSWEYLAEPRAIVEGLAREAGVTLLEVDRIPHDLWSAADLPPLAWYDRLLMVTTQFNLTVVVEREGRDVRLVPITERVQIERSYPASGDLEVALARYRSLAPNAEISKGDKTLIVRGRIEDHEQLTKPQPSATSPSKGIEVFSLTLADVPLDKLLASLEKRLDVTFQFDRPAIAAAGIKLDQLVSVEVVQQPLEGLLRAALVPAGLTFKRNGKTIDVFPK